MYRFDFSNVGKKGNQFGEIIPDSDCIHITDIGNMLYAAYFGKPFYIPSSFLEHYSISLLGVFEISFEILDKNNAN